jgi:hypothetical protein
MLQEQSMHVLREPVNYCCEGCGRVDPEDHSVCTAYAFPDSRWKHGVCALATHVMVAVEKTNTKVRVGQQKQKKGA